MGKGDQSTRRGKIRAGSYGNARPKSKKSKGGGRAGKAKTGRK